MIIEFKHGYEGKDVHTPDGGMMGAMGAMQKAIWKASLSALEAGHAMHKVIEKLNKKDKK